MEERTLLHLLSYSRFINHWEVPFPLTQEGIAESIGIARCNVSRAMKRILKKQLVQERTAHVKGVARKRKVYFLSHDGEVMANELKDNLGGTSVRVKMHDGTVRTMRMDEVGMEFENRPTLLEVLRHTSPENTLDLRNLRSDVDKGVVDFTDAAPAVRTFFGREKELEELRGALAERRAVFIYGLAGIGKSTLVSRLMDESRGSRNIFWYRFHEWTTNRNLLGSLGEFLHAMGKPQLRDKVESAISLDPHEYNGLLLESLRGANALMVFDDAQKGQLNVLEVFRSLLEPDNGIDDANFIVISREMLPLYDRSMVNVHSTVGEMWLEGLDRNSAMELLENRTRDVSNFEQIYAQTDGHPLMMELICSAGDVVRSKGDIKRYIHEQIFAQLSGGERHLIQAASIFRYPVPSEILLGAEGTRYETLDRLVERAFIQYDQAGYLVHDLIRDFSYERLVPAERKDLHLKAARYYLSESEKALRTEEMQEMDAPTYDIVGSFELNCVEAMHHYINAGEVREAAQLAVMYGDILVSKGYLEEFSLALEQMGTTDLDPTQWSELSLLKGDISENSGRWEEALSFFSAPMRYEKGTMDWPELQIPGFGIEGESRVIQVGGGEGPGGDAREGVEGATGGDPVDSEPVRLPDDNGSADPVGAGGEVDGDEVNVSLMLTIAKAHRKMGQLKKEQGLWSEARANFEEALKITEEYGDLKGTAESQRGLGFIHWRLGEYNSALAYLNKSQRIIRKTEDLGALASTFMDMGNVYKDQGEYAQAIEHYYRAVGILEGLSHLKEMTRAYINLGAAYVHMEEYRRAADYFTKCVELADKIGHKKRKSWGLFNLAESLAFMGKLTRARELVDQSMEIAEEMDDQAAIAYNHRVLGIIHARRRSFDLAEMEFEESMAIQERYKMVYHLAETMVEYGKMLALKGDKGKAVRKLRQAHELFKGLNNLAYMDRVKKVLKTME